MAENMRNFFKPDAVIKRQKINNKNFWRFDFNYMEASVMLLAYTEVNGIVYYISAVYNNKGDKYWRPVFDKILEKWQIGESLGEINANILPSTNTPENPDIVAAENSYSFSPRPSLFSLKFYIEIILRIILKGLLGVIPAFILRFVFKKRYKIWWAVLC